MSETHSEFVAGLRELADWWEQHPEVDSQYALDPINLPVNGKVALSVAARALGRCEKYGDDMWFGVRRRFGPITLDVYDHRDNVCTRVVTGTREVVREIPDPDAPTVTVTQTEDIVDWVCEPLLAVEAAR